MRFIVLILSSFIISLSGCKTNGAVDYFGHDELGDNWSAASFAGYLNIFYEKPLKDQKLKEGESVYRILILQPSDPVHMIKVKTSRDGFATVSMKRTKVGYRRQGSKTVNQSRTLKLSKADVSKFLNVIFKHDFWVQDKATQYEYGGDEMLTHPPFFLIEARSGNRNIGYFDFEKNLRKNTASIASAFYMVAGLNEEDDWTLAEFFLEFTKEDWTYEE